MFKILLCSFTILITMSSCIYGVPNKTMLRPESVSLIDSSQKNIRLDFFIINFNLDEKVVVDFVITRASSSIECPHQVAWSVEGFLPKNVEKFSLLYGSVSPQFNQFFEAKNMIKGCQYDVLIMNGSKKEALKFVKE